MLDVAFKNLWSAKLRTALCILGITACVFLINTVDGMLNNMREDISQNLARYMGKITLVEKRATEFNSIKPSEFIGTIEENIAKQALSLDSLNQKESTSLLPFVIVPAKQPMSASEIGGLGIDPGKEKAWLAGIKVSSGKATFIGEAKNSAILGGWANGEYYHTAVGRKIKIFKKKAEVIGILEKTNNMDIDTTILVPLSFAQEVKGVERKVATVLLTARDLDQVDKLARKAKAKFPDLDVVSQNQMKERADSMMEMPNRFLNMISWTVFGAALILILTVMTMAIRERVKEIGTLRALGARRHAILTTVCLESLFLGVIGGILGILLTIPASYALDWPWILSAQNMTKVFFLSPIAGGLGGLYPAWRATRVNPLEALRYE